jgi:hypothetical protein
MILSAATLPTIDVGAMKIICGADLSKSNSIEADTFLGTAGATRLGAAYFSAGASMSVQASTTSSTTIDATLFGITNGRLPSTCSSVPHAPRVHLYSCNV